VLKSVLEFDSQIDYFKFLVEGLGEGFSCDIDVLVPFLESGVALERIFKDLFELSLFNVVLLLATFE